MDTEPKYTLITGGNRGIGKALARELAGRGINLLVNNAGLDKPQAAFQCFSEGDLGIVLFVSGDYSPEVLNPVMMCVSLLERVSTGTVARFNN
jgi:NAD(P)-dependent dehydrogenase (short-subunit alcohol dehydrogenase family)